MIYKGSRVAEKERGILEEYVPSLQEKVSSGNPARDFARVRYTVKQN